MSSSAKSTTRASKIVSKIVEIGQTVVKISRLTVFKKVAVRHLEFQNFKILVADFVGRANVHHRAKFHRYRRNNFRDIAIYHF